MAGKAVVGALRVTLGLDSAQFHQGLTKSQQGMARFASMAKAGALAVGAAMVAGAGVMAAAMKGVIDDADKMYKLSQAIGVPIEELSKLRYAAELAGVDLDSLGKAVKRLSMGMMDASESATGPAAKAFSMLGIQIKDAEGKMKPASRVVEELAGRFAKMPDGVEKTALAMRIFGKSGADMIPLLNSGAAGLREMYEEAEELGLVLDEETGKAAERFNDNLTRMGKIKDGIVTKITANMLPALDGLAEAMVVAAKNSGLMQGAGQALGWVLKALATSVVTLSGFFVALAGDIAMAAKVAAAWARSDFAGAYVAFVEGNARRERTLATIKDINTAIWRPQTGGMDRPPAVEGLDLIEAGGNRARRSVERLSEAEREAKRAAEELRREGERVFEQTRTPAEQYAATVERLGRLLRATAIDQDTFNRAMLEAKDLFERDDPVMQSRRSIEEKRRQFLQDSAEEQMRLARDHREYLEAATYDGIRGGLEAAADGNLGQYLAMRIRSALLDNLAGTLTDLFIGKGKGDGGGIFGSLSSLRSSLGSVFNMFRSGIPGFASGVENFGGGLAYVHKGEVLANLPKGTDVISAADVRKGGGGGGQVIHVAPSKYFDVRVQEVSTPLAAGAFAGARQTVPADMARTQRYTRGRR